MGSRGCPIPGSIQSQVGRGFEKPELVKDVPGRGRGTGLKSYHSDILSPTTEVLQTPGLQTLKPGHTTSRWTIIISQLLCRNIQLCSRKRHLCRKKLFYVFAHIFFLMDNFNFHLNQVAMPEREHLKKLQPKQKTSFSA